MWIMQFNVANMLCADIGAELKSKPSFTKSTTSKKTSSSVAQTASTSSQSHPQQQQQIQQQQQQQQQQSQQTAVDMYAYTNPDPNAMYSYDPNTYYQYYQYWQQQQQPEQQSSDDTAAQGSTSDDPFADMDDATVNRGLIEARLRNKKLINFIVYTTYWQKETTRNWCQDQDNQSARYAPNR